MIIEVGAPAYSATAPTQAPIWRMCRGVAPRLVSAGVDLIKVYTHVDAALLRAIVDEAHAFNLSVTGHLGMTDALAAAKVGISGIEHMSGVPEAASKDPSALFAAHYRGFLQGWTASERSWANLDSAALTRVAARLAEQAVFTPRQWVERFERAQELEQRVGHDAMRINSGLRHRGLL